MKQAYTFSILAIVLTGCMKHGAADGPIDVAAVTVQPLQTQTDTPKPASPGAVSSKSNTQPGTLYTGSTAIGGSTSKAAAARTGNVSLDLDDADVATAAKAVLGDIMKVSYSVDARVKGKISVKTQGRIPVAQAISLFEESLLQNGAALVENDGAYSVIPATEAATSNTFAIRNAAGGATQPGYGVRAVPLRHISAKEMSEILSPLSKDAVLRIDHERNVIVLQGTSAQFGSLMETIRTFDVDWLSNKSVGVFRLGTMSAAEMTKGLTQLLQNENIDATMARFVALDSGNAIIAVAKTPQILASIRRWVQRLDQVGGSELRLFTYEMRHVRAADVAPLVAGALGIQSVVSGKDSLSGRASSGNSSTKSGQAGLGSRQGLASPTVPGSADPAGNAAAMGAAALSPGRAVLDPARRMDGASADAGQTARIIADESSNKLLVYASSAQFDKVKDVVRTIDVPQKQVLVEATIIEVSLNDELKYGAQFYLDKMINGTMIKGSLTPGSTGSLGPQSPGGSLSIGVDTKAILDALSGVTRINVISSPNIMVMNNQPARLVVGDQIPVTTQTRSDPLSAANVQVSAVEFRDTGIIFDVTPRVNSSGTVTLDILQEVSAIKRNSGQSLTPTISQRRVTSTVVAGNNETIVIGGLFSTDRQGSRSGLPILSDIPRIGGLFGRTTNSEVKTELLLLISPRIVNDRNDAKRLTRELQDRITDLRLIETSPLRKAPARPATASPCAPSSNCVAKRY